MVGYEYKVIPAPAKGLKAPGVKGPEARFANTLEKKMNELAADGWEYQRSDILPSEERQGLTSTQTVYRSVLVFRRALTAKLPEDETEAYPVTQDDEVPVEADDQEASDTAEPDVETAEDVPDEDAKNEKSPA